MDTLLLVACYADFDAPALSALTETLPSERRERALRAKDPSARAGTVLAYRLLAFGARSLLGRDDLPPVSVGTYGKPFFEDGSLAFSISHSKDGVAVLLSKASAAVGVDLEGIRALRPELIERFSSASERREIRTAEDAVALWTRKEAVLKRTGLGLRGHLPEVDVSDTRSILLSVGGIPSVLSVSPATVLKGDTVVRFLSPAELLQ